MMSAKGTRGAKMPPASPTGKQKSLETANLSSIDGASFMEGLQQNHGNPLHSTAIEEDLNVLEEAQKNKGRVEGVNIPQTKRKMVQDTPVNEEQKQKREKRKSENNGASGNTQSLEQSEAIARKRRNIIPSSDDDGEDESWKPSPKKTRVRSLGKTRKSSGGTAKKRTPSSGSTSAAPQNNKNFEWEVKQGKGGTELEVVLAAFLDFCNQYRDFVESKAVKESIDSFSQNVKLELLEKISSTKTLRVLMRENAKATSLINKKRQRLLEAKNELMRAERQLHLLQKEESDLQLRLTDLRRSQAFLSDIRELNRQYLDYRQTHPQEKEKYGASSLPALLLESKQIGEAECQLRRINNYLEKKLDHPAP